LHNPATATLQNILEQNKALLEGMNAVMDGFKENKLVLEEIKNELRELHKDNVKLRCRNALNFGQSDTHATDLSEAAYLSVFSGLGGSADSPSSLHDPEVPGSTCRATTSMS
jgi:hypothetical protein